MAAISSASAGPDPDAAVAAAPDDSDPDDAVAAAPNDSNPRDAVAAAPDDSDPDDAVAVAPDDNEPHYVAADAPDNDDPDAAAIAAIAEDDRENYDQSWSDDDVPRAMPSAVHEKKRKHSPACDSDMTPRNDNNASGGGDDEEAAVASGEHPDDGNDNTRMELLKQRDLEDDAFVQQKIDDETEELREHGVGEVMDDITYTPEQLKKMSSMDITNPQTGETLHKKAWLNRVCDKTDSVLKKSRDRKHRVQDVGKNDDRKGSKGSSDQLDNVITSLGPAFLPVPRSISACRKHGRPFSNSPDGVGSPLCCAITVYEVLQRENDLPSKLSKQREWVSRQ